MEKLTPYQESLLAPKSISLKKKLVIALFMFGPLVLASLVFYEYKYEIGTGFHNWLYFCVLLWVIFHWVLCVAWIVRTVLWHFMKWVSRQKLNPVEFKEIVVRYDLNEDLVNEYSEAKSKFLFNQRLLKTAVNVSRKRLKIVRLFNFLVDCVLFSGLVTNGYSILASFYLFAILLQHSCRFHMRKSTLAYIKTLHDPLEQKEKVNIDDLSDKLFHGEP